ncbi:MAG TPA: hypothetical protein VMX97_13370, partial [Hyphomicrobiaceae bacterium]|nr:hypothetical protein [Hyphomicrobiaceae bacterium]
MNSFEISVLIVTNTYTSLPLVRLAGWHSAAVRRRMAELSHNRYEAALRRMRHHTNVRRHQ